MIPVHLDRVWGSIFSFKDGRFFWKWPKHFLYPVTVTFGEPLPATHPGLGSAHALLEMGAEAFAVRRKKSDLVPTAFIRTAKRRWFRFCMADSLGRELTFGAALTASLMLAKRFRRDYRDQQRDRRAAAGLGRRRRW